MTCIKGWMKRFCSCKPLDRNIGKTDLSYSKNFTKLMQKEWNSFNRNQFITKLDETQPAFTCTRLTIETQDVKYAQC